MRWKPTAGVWAAMTGAVVATSLLLIARPARPADPPGLDGFAAEHLASQRDVEQRLRRFPSPRRIESDHRFLTAEPHVAGSPRDRALAEWTRDQWIAAGLDSVDIVEHHVLLPRVDEVSVEIVGPHPWRATLREHPGDPIAFHAYSANGDITAVVIDAGAGTPADFDRLAGHGLDVRGKIVLARYAVPYRYRGSVVYTAQQRGAAAVLMYPEPGDGDSPRGATYPAGLWGPDDRIQRGGVAFDFIAPGDPGTPGWASTPGARRLPRADAPTLPAIMSVPISTSDALVIRDAMRGGAVTLRVLVHNDEAVRPIWTVVGRIVGSRDRDQWVIAGNHRDAWMYGGVDPSSGSAVLMEMARALGALKRSGDRPKRTIVLASWDAEEFGLTSSTEWAEEHELELREKAVAYLNVDAAVSGSTFFARAVPSLARVVAATAGVNDSTIETRIGAGSDYTAFLDFVGVPIVDMRFQGPYGVYHSAYDTHDWVARFADPGFLRHAELARIWATLAARLANADLLPIDPVRYARRIGDFVGEIERRRGDELTGLKAALARLSAAAILNADASSAALAQGNASGLEILNRRLMTVEPSFIDPGGLDGRPWYRHQLYAPAFTYEPEVLPGLSEAVDSGKPSRIAEQERRIAAALDRAAQALAPSDVKGPP
jgi:N-acetylated-alpha-linked acidic dipeptidase